VTHLIRLAFSLYSLAWLIAIPFLKRSARVSLGWPERTMQDSTPKNVDIWIQAASGGESQLTAMILAELAKMTSPRKKLTVLATSGTQQGIESLHKGRKCLPADSGVEVTVAFFPLDAPFYMRKAFSRYAPKVAIIVETELWPGFLYQAHRTNTRVLLVNGRMSAKSFRTYKYFHSFFTTYGPERIWSVGEQDRERFSRVFGPGRVELMNNIKFDRMSLQSNAAENTALRALVPEHVPFVLLGSVRREEEQKITSAIVNLLERRADIIIGLFPKHIERAAHWLSTLERAGIPARRRSTVTGNQSPGSVIVWDVFGELAGAYALARTAFVGGSLVDLGGQNFLEPLASGVKPIIGPYWWNFAWVSREIIDSGLVHEVSDESGLVEKILSELSADNEKEGVIQKVQDFFSSRKGGAAFIGRQIVQYLSIPVNQ
jgi:3-deoxy-D-manno-octulosonic-acid transferase